MKKDVHYRYNIPDKITVLVDTREQYPVLFPKSVRISHPENPHKELVVGVDERREGLKAGDYALEGFEDICIIERKAAQLEIFKNLTDPKDQLRQAKAFRKLITACEYPYIMIECSPAQLLSGNEHIKNPEIVCHRLGLTLAKYGLHALFIPWRSRSAEVRRKLGTLMIHIMLGCVLSKTYDVPVNLLEK